MYWNMLALGLSYTGMGAVQLLPSGVPRDTYTAAEAGEPGVRYATHTAYRVPSTGSAAMFGASVQRKPPGEVALNGTVWLSGTVNTVPDTGKLTPPSVDLAHMTLLGELMGLD